MATGNCAFLRTPPRSSTSRKNCAEVPEYSRARVKFLLLDSASARPYRTCAWSHLKPLSSHWRERADKIGMLVSGPIRRLQMPVQSPAETASHESPDISNRSLAAEKHPMALSYSVCFQLALADSINSRARARRRAV